MLTENEIREELKRCEMLQEKRLEKQLTTNTRLSGYIEALRFVLGEIK